MIRVPMGVRKATDADVPAILQILAANQTDSSLFQQSEQQVRRTLGDFFVAVREDVEVIGCAALHWHAADNAEILAVAVSPEGQGKGVGSQLMEECIARATLDGAAALLWLATAKPSYFARFGFRPMSRFRLPTSVLWTKFLLVFQQEPKRWFPALVGRHTFMVRS